MKGKIVAIVVVIAIVAAIITGISIHNARQEYYKQLAYEAFVNAGKK